jgi:hypothetical protein
MHMHTTNMLALRLQLSLGFSIQQLLQMTVTSLGPTSQVVVVGLKMMGAA